MTEKELNINQYPREVTSPMAAFEIAVIQYADSSKTNYQFKKLRIARKELAEAIVKYSNDTSRS